MNYIKKADVGKKYINKLCLKSLTTYEAYIKGVKSSLNIKTNIPVYINKKIILFPICNIRNYDCIWINYTNIKAAYNDENKTVIIFKNGERIKINVKTRKFMKLIENVHKIISYKENIEINIEMVI